MKTSRSFVLLGGLTLFFLVLVSGVHSLSPPEPVKPIIPRCGPVCAIYCRYGNVMDDRGCPTCRCRQRPVKPIIPRCGPVCAIYCRYGNVMDDRGCPTCRCRQRPVKPIIPRCGPVCDIHCRYGNVMDDEGCPTCQCRQKPICLQRRCPKDCIHGYRTFRGCPTCICKGPPRPPVCSLIHCRRFCPNGFVTDSRGCSTCTCKPRIEFPKPPLCGAMCLMHCPNGFVMGSDGCPLCKCRPFLELPVDVRAVA